MHISRMNLCPMFVHVTRDNGGNVLSIDSLMEMDADLVALKADERVQLSAVVSWTTLSPGMIQIALDEQSSGTTLADYPDWPSLIDAIVGMTLPVVQLTKILIYLALSTL